MQKKVYFFFSGYCSIEIQVSNCFIIYSKLLLSLSKYKDYHRVDRESVFELTPHGYLQLSHTTPLYKVTTVCFYGN